MTSLERSKTIRRPRNFGSARLYGVRGQRSPPHSRTQRNHRQGGQRIPRKAVGGKAVGAESRRFVGWRVLGARDRRRKARLGAAASRPQQYAMTRTEGVGNMETNVPNNSAEAASRSVGGTNA